MIGERNLDPSYLVQAHTGRRGADGGKGGNKGGSKVEGAELRKV